METIQLIIDLHKRAQRQGPGGDRYTRQAIDLAMLGRQTPLKIADIGCGTGASTLLLAQELNAHITAVDFLPEFIEVLKTRATSLGLMEKIDPLVCSMDKLPFEDGEYDVIWSEGAIYNMGFEKGVNAWRRYLKPGGYLAVSEITWTTNERPAELQQFWEGEYSEIATAAAKMRVLEEGGYAPIGYFSLPEQGWLDNYYHPMQDGFAAFLARHADNEKAQALVDVEKQEIALYKTYKGYYSYGFYIARKVAPL